MVFMGRWGARARVARPARHSLTGKVPVQRARAPRTVSSSSEIKSEAGGQGATIAVGNEEEPHPPPARSSGARPKERRRGAGPPSWRASTPPEKLQNLAQEDRGSAAPVVSVAPLSATETGIKRPVGPRKLPLLSGKGPWEQWREPAGPNTSNNQPNAWPGSIREDWSQPARATAQGG
ncbi:unnamed protein product [Prorocentrum cordatum]|uniref:Uncharacterized protein n=1 Tax=Prorocentrum cordatum TaxID=2364126 RepID=A0ABN9U486_9DINO|nr:unnamed protein product [Polarella glacialis]